MELDSPTPPPPSNELVVLLQNVSEQIRKLGLDLKNEVRQEAINTTRQLEAFQSLQALVGDIPAGFHGWPISPDFALGLVRLIRDHHYNLIVELGSGTSTFIELRALDLFDRPQPTDKTAKPRLFAFEHNEFYLSKTEALVQRCTNRAELDLCLSPLTPWSDFIGDFSYYSGIERIAEALKTLQAHHAVAPLKMLVVVDGPPGATCHWARYPAIPVVLDACSGLNVSIDFLVDDMIRTDEKEMAEAWEASLRMFDLHYERFDYDYEKGGMLLRLSSLSDIETTLTRRSKLEKQQREKVEIAKAVTEVEELLVKLDTFTQNAALETEEFS